MDSQCWRYSSVSRWKAGPLASIGFVKLHFKFKTKRNKTSAGLCSPQSESLFHIDRSTKTVLKQNRFVFLLFLFCFITTSMFVIGVACLNLKIFIFFSLSLFLPVLVLRKEREKHKSICDMIAIVCIYFSCQINFILILISSIQLVHWLVYQTNF